MGRAGISTGGSGIEEGIALEKIVDGETPDRTKSGEGEKRSCSDVAVESKMLTDLMP